MMPEYKIGKYTKSKLKLSQLELDLENFRIGKQKNQSDAIHAMLTRSSTKVSGLAESIAVNGFHDLELPCVFPSSDSSKFVVAEGNRRITVLKALKTASLANGTPLYGRFKKLSSELKQSLPNEIECAVFENRKECLAYVLMRHGYGADGSGLMRWDAISKLRADAYVNGTIHPELSVIDFVENDGTLGQDKQQNLDDDDFKITNLQRIVDDASIRKLLGIDAKDITKSSYGKKWLLAIWQKVIEVIIDGQHRGEKFTVDKNINDSSLRNKFIGEIIEDVHGKSSAAVKPTPDPLPVNSSGQGKKGAAVVGEHAPKQSSPTKHITTKERKSLIAKTFVPGKLEPQRIVNIVDELRKLSVADFNNCSGVMFRVFLELSIVHYMKKNSISDKVAHNKSPNVFVEMKLREKIAAVVKYLEDKNILTHLETKPLRDIKAATHALSAESLNSYVHNPSFEPEPTSLKLGWDNLQNIFTILWAK